MAKIALFPKGDDVDVRALLHVVLEEDKLEAVLIAHRVDGDWAVSWGGAGLKVSSLALAAMMVQKAVSDEIMNDDDD